MTRTQPLEPAALRSAFGAFPSGVVAVAAEVEGRSVGLAASSFTSVSLDPPLASFSVARSSTTWPRLRRSRRIGVSVLAEHHGDYCRRLAGPPAHRFAGQEVAGSSGGALYVTDAVAWFECSVAREVEAGDHLIVLLGLHGVDDSGSGRPLVFHRSLFHRIDGVALQPVISGAG